jgi:hypothetical protein
VDASGLAGQALTTDLEILTERVRLALSPAFCQEYRNNEHGEGGSPGRSTSSRRPGEGAPLFSYRDEGCGKETAEVNRGNGNFT